MKVCLLLLAILFLSSAKLETLKLEHSLTATAKEFDQKLDHFDNTGNTPIWKQRYFEENLNKWEDDKTGPLILFICGEGPCSAPAAGSFIFDLA